MSRYLRRPSICWLAPAVLVLAMSTNTGVDGAPDPDVDQPLFVTGQFPKGWTFFAAERGARLEHTWKLIKPVGDDGPVLVCVGQPHGYLRTEDRQYDNFEFSLEWNYPNDSNGNSGILIHTHGPDRIWPKAIQVQLHRPTAGSIFPIGGAETENTVRRNDLDLPINQWHKCVITSIDGRITVEINGGKVGAVNATGLDGGSIALQSEGSEIHFRRVRVRRLPKERS